MTIPAIDFGFITCAELKDLDPDDQLLFKALENKGYKCQAFVWDDLNVEWQSMKVAIIRSTWDYHLKFGAFLEWIDLVSSKTTLVNHQDLIRWNIDKHYLHDLSKSGWPIVPTTYLEQGQTINILSLLKDQGWSDIVVKPTVGIGTSGVKRINNSRIALGEGQQHIEKLLKTGDVMVQPYYSSVEYYGERNLVFIDGNYSHCVRKTAFQTLAVAGEAGETIAQADDAELLLAQKIIQKIKPQPFYARVDLVRDHTNQPCLMELELTEPNLFFAFHPPAIEKCAARLIQLLKRSYPAVPVS